MRIGVDLGGTKIEIIAIDDHGAVALRRRAPTPQDDYAKIVGAIAELVCEAEAELGGLASVGVGMPGAVSLATGRIKNANTTCLIGQPLSEDLAAALARPIRVANDANCFALSEAVDGAAAGACVVFGVIIGTGTGGGVVVDGVPLHGRNAIAGEWGHNPLPWPRDDERPGPACYCGRSGCIETFISGPGLMRDHVRGGGDRSLHGAQIAEAAQAGDAKAYGAVERYADRLARSLASVINVLDPEVIVLGGGVSNIEWLYQEVPRRWGQWVFSDRVDTALRPAMHGDSSGVRGAAWLWPR